MCLTVALWDRIYPMVFGLPFNLFWLMLWTVLTPVCLFCAYQVESSRKRAQNPPRSGSAK